MNEMTRLIQQAKYYKEMYPAGTRIHLNNMEDPHAPVPAGTRGTVAFVDDIGQLHMHWDNGRTLAIVPKVDSFRKLTDKELAEEQKNVQFEYTLHIHRYDRYMTFENIHDLKDELKRYFTPKELASGVVDRLINFERKNTDGFYRNSFQDFEVCCYEKESTVSFKKAGLDSQINSAASRTGTVNFQTDKKEPEKTI